MLILTFGSPSSAPGWQRQGSVRHQVFQPGGVDAFRPSLVRGPHPPTTVPVNVNVDVTSLNGAALVAAPALLWAEMEG